MSEPEDVPDHGLVDDSDTEVEATVNEKLRIQRARKRKSQRQRRAESKLNGDVMDGTHAHSAPSGDKSDGGAPSNARCCDSCVEELEDEMKASTPTKAGTGPDQGGEKTSYIKTAGMR